MRAQRRCEHGTSLIELIATIALSAVLATMAVSLVRAVFLGIHRHDTDSSLQQAAAAALDLMTRDIQMAGCAASLSSHPGIRSALASSIQLATDLNADSDSDDANERVTYAVNRDKGTLTRASGNGSPQPLLHNLEVNGLRFQYYGRESELPAPGASEEALRSIASVRVQMKLRNDEGDDLPPLSRVATLRNR